MRERALRLLLVEDDDDHARLVQLAAAEVEVAPRIERARDGNEALEYLHRTNGYAGRPRPDLILLDLDLPVVKGHDVLARIKDDSDLRTIPVVVLTSSDNHADKTTAYRHHANGYVVKPADCDEFGQMIRDLCRYWGCWNQVAR